jgi:hypothetical protein
MDVAKFTKVGARRCYFALRNVPGRAAALENAIGLVLWPKGMVPFLPAWPSPHQIVVAIQGN